MVVNARGNVFDLESGQIIAGVRLDRLRLFRDSPSETELLRSRGLSVGQVSCFSAWPDKGVESTLAGDRTRTSGSGDLCDIHFTTRAFAEA